MAKGNFWNKFKKFFIKAGKTSLDILYPQDLKCIFCGNDIPDFETQPYCHDCEKEHVLNDGHRCKFCDMPLHTEHNVCDYCQNGKHKFDKAFSPFVYNNMVRKAILKFKDDNGKYLIKTFTKYICEKIKEANITIDCIIPIPSHKKTIKQRGYNQANLLAQSIGKKINAIVDNGNITKEIYTKPQKTLSFQERQKNIYSSLKIKDPKKYEGQNILIVDDVLTTCATVNAVCSLIRPHVHNIYVATIARRDIEDSYKK